MKVAASIILTVSIAALASPLYAQVSTATPAPIILRTATPISSAIATAAHTATASQTASAGIQVEARDRANVRAQPDVNSEQLGEILAGDRYPALGRFFRWILLEFRFGPAWVFEELVVIHGDPSALPEIDLLAIDPAAEAAATLALIQQTPGGLQTATASARFIAASSERPAVGGISPLPTFTFPPQYAPPAGPEQVLPTAAAPAPASRGPLAEIPPIYPIVILAGAGLLGLLITALRR